MQLPNVPIINMTILMEGMDFFIPFIRAFFWLNLFRFNFFKLRDFLGGDN